MVLKFNVTGARRKALVDEIASIDGSSKQYLGVPSCAYQVGDFHISKDGVVTADEAKLRDILETLKAAGFEPIEEAFEAPEAAQVPEKEEAPGKEPDQETDPAESEQAGLAFEIPLDGFDDNALQNLDNLIKAKGGLIRKALGVEELPVMVGEQVIRFPWYTATPEPDEINACSLLITRLCELARNQQRISAKEKEVENEKYAFRCFLLRLGFIGDEFKKQRKILLSRLLGSSAFKSGGPRSEA